MSDSRLATVLTVLPVLSAGLYLLGATYYQGYLDGFGLEESLFPLATDRLLFFGFFSLINFSIVPMLYTVLAIFLLILIVIIATVLSSTSRAKRWQALIEAKIASHRIMNEPSQKMIDLADKSTTIYLYIVGISFVVIFLIAIAVLSTKGGQKQAQKEIEAFKNNKGNTVVLNAEPLSTPTRAKQIICSTSHCAFWLGTDTMVLRHEDIKYVVAHKPSPQNSSQTIKSDNPE